MTDAAAVGPALATSLGVPHQPGAGLVDSLISFLAPKRLLLVVDNCEHVLDAAGPLLESIIRRCRGVVELATSRTRLGVVGEHVGRLPRSRCRRAGGRVAAVDRDLDNLRATVTQVATSVEIDIPAPAQTGRAASSSEQVGANSLLGLSQARVYAGDPEGGLAFAEDRYRVAELLGNPSMLALALCDQAESLASIEPEQARERYERAIRLAESAGSTFIEGIAVVGLASLLGGPAPPFRCSARSSTAGVAWGSGSTSGRRCATSSSCSSGSATARPPPCCWEPSEPPAPRRPPTGRTRMAGAARSLEAALGASAWAAAVGRGAAMSADQAVDYVRAAIDRAPDGARG